MVERASVPTIRSSKDSLAFKDIILKASLIDISGIFEDAELFGSILIVSAKEVVFPLFFSLSIKNVILEISSIDNIPSNVHTFSVSSAVFHISLIVMTVGINEPSVAVGEPSCESSFIKASRRVEILPNSMRFTIIPLALVYHTCSNELKELVWLRYTSVSFHSSSAFFFNRF